MHISDLVGQYNRNVSQDVSVAAPAPGVQQLIDEIQDMTAGSIFEGTVNEIHRGEVVLGLGNGQTIAARIAAGISLSKGQSMFFQVKSNNGSQVEIRPYTRGNLSNPILLKALDTAGIPASDRTVTMVNAMMEEQMSIDKQSLLDMARLVGTQPEIDVKTIVQMKKLGLPVTPEMSDQFLNYKLGKAAITDQMEAVFEALSGAFSDEMQTEGEALNQNGRLMEILLGGTDGTAGEDRGMLFTPAEPSEVSAAEAVQMTDEAAKEGLPAEELPGRSQTDYAEGMAGRLLSDAQADALNRQLGELLPASGRELNLELSPKELLMELQRALQQAELPEAAPVKKLFAGEPYQKLLRNALEQEWLLKPEDVKNPDKVRDVYRKLEHQMAQLERLLDQGGAQKNPLMRASAEVRGNVEFMNQISQNYTYLQIPLKLSGQNAHSDLYVYSNKKNLSDPEGELTAFLHLDLDNLGSTDVSIRMQGKKVHTDFFLADNKSYDLIEAHMDILEERLEKKGYQCTIQVQNREKKTDFVEDFLKKDQPSAGKLHRYSFDVRA